MAMTVSPRAIRRMLTELREISDPRIGEVEGGRRAGRFADWYSQASGEQRRECWLLMSEQFAPDPGTFDAAPVVDGAPPGADDAVRAEIRFRSALQTPRRRLLQRFAGFPG